MLDEPALGAHDPPARTVVPADAAGFDLKNYAVELQDDPAVTAGIDTFPRGGE